MIGDWFLTSETRDWVLQTGLGYTYNYWLVALSAIVGILASYSAFRLVGRVSDATDNAAKIGWLTTASISMGSGVWSMHFIAMLAVQLPAHVHYNWVLTALSAFFSIIASGCAFSIITLVKRTRIRLWCSGIVLGIGIGTMHYTGMASMNMDGGIRYDPLMFIASAVVAVSLSSLSLRLLYRELEGPTSSKRLYQMLGGSVMGGSIASIHYTGMAATYFLPSDLIRVSASDFESSLLAIVVAVGAVLFIVTSLIASMLDQARNIKRLEASLNKQSLASIINHVADAIITIDHIGTIQTFNPAAERMFGYPRDDILGKNVSLLTTSEHRERHGQYLENANLHGQRVLGQTRPLKGQRKGGETFDVEINISSMAVDDKRVFVGVCSDVTMRHQIESALRDAKDSADVANRAKSEFLANMSHELRTPLNAIMGFSELIKKQSLGPVGIPRYLEYATDIYDAGQHLLDLVNDILDLSKIEAGETALNEEEFDVEEEVRAVLRFINMRAKNDGVSLEVDSPQLPAPIYADRRLVKQILTNLFSNAVKFTENGGTVKLKYWSQDESGYIFQVSDTGIGIAPEDIPDALAPFSQVDNKLNRNYEGTGLGLPLTKSMVELHGGSLDIQSQVGVGTTVTVRFPAQRIGNVPELVQSKSA